MKEIRYLRVAALVAALLMLLRHAARSLPGLTDRLPRVSDFLANPFRTNEQIIGMIIIAAADVCTCYSMTATLYYFPSNVRNNIVSYTIV